MAIYVGDKRYAPYIGDKRRRYMGEGSADEIIMTSTSNPEVMAVCYTQGWAAHADYMTKSEAEAVTSVGTVFSSSSIGDFHEFQYFTSVTSLAQRAFRDSTISGITFPNSITTIGQLAFNNCANLTSIKLNEGVTSVGNQWIWQTNSMKLIDFPSTITTMTSLGFQTNGRIYYNCICRATTPPSLGSSSYTSYLSAFYVPDDSVDLYKAASKWADFATKIKPLSEYTPS